VHYLDGNEKQIFQHGGNDEYRVATARTVDDASKLVAVGFEFVMNMTT
jgi:hypothetical protein